jgi:hypothetical protein
MQPYSRLGFQPPSANSNIEYGWTGGPFVLIGPDGCAAQVSSCFATHCNERFSSGASGLP